MISLDERDSILTFMDSKKNKMEQMMQVKGVPDLDEDRRLRKSEHLKKGSKYNLFNQKIHDLIQRGEKITALADEYGLPYRHLQARISKAKKLGIITCDDKEKAMLAAEDVNDKGFTIGQACSKYSLSRYKFKTLIGKYKIKINKDEKLKKTKKRT